MSIKILRKPEVLGCFAFSRSTLYSRIEKGIIPPPIKLGGARAVGWLEHEIHAVLAAMVANKNTDELKALVTNLIDQRKNAIDNIGLINEIKAIANLSISAEDKSEG